MLPRYIHKYSLQFPMHIILCFLIIQESSLLFQMCYWYHSHLIYFSILHAIIFPLFYTIHMLNTLHKLSNTYQKLDTFKIIIILILLYHTYLINHLFFHLNIRCRLSIFYIYLHLYNQSFHILYIFYNLNLYLLYNF